MATMSTLPTVAVIGGTGTTGGWVVECAVKRGHKLRVLTLTSSVLSNFSSKINIIVGNSANKSALQELLYDGNILLVETLVCVTSEMSIADQLVMAKALSSLFWSNKTKPRVVWMTEDANSDDIAIRPEDSIYPVKAERPCFELPLVKMDLGCLFPFLQQPISEYENIEEFVLKSLKTKAVIIRPSAALESVPYATFTNQWRILGGDNPNYQLLGLEDGNQHPTISRRALASAILDLIIDESRDGTAVFAVQRQGKTHPIVLESVEL